MLSSVPAYVLDVHLRSNHLILEHTKGHSKIETEDCSSATGLFTVLECISQNSICERSGKACQTQSLFRENIGFGPPSHCPCQCHTPALNPSHRIWRRAAEPNQTKPNVHTFSENVCFTSIIRIVTCDTYQKINYVGTVAIDVGFD